ncbi:hypothetical protein [Deinococcus altitudinis]|uniref:hypothetical protein n=1 Tax=Deinococcus altitudinis TaxID=468914 RepID=UPI0038928E87
MSEKMSEKEELFLAVQLMNAQTLLDIRDAVRDLRAHLLPELRMIPPYQSEIDQELIAGFGAVESLLNDFELSDLLPTRLEAEPAGEVPDSEL